MRHYIIVVQALLAVRDVNPAPPGYGREQGQTFQLPNIHSADYDTDPVHDMEAGMLNVRMDGVPDSNYYTLVLKVADALDRGEIERVRDSYHKGRKGVHTEMYNSPFYQQQVRLPSVADLEDARTYFESNDEIPVQHEYPPHHSPSYNYAHRYDKKGYTEDQKERLLSRMIRRQDYEEGTAYGSYPYHRYGQYESINSEADAFIRKVRRGFTM